MQAGFSISAHRPGAWWENGRRYIMSLDGKDGNYIFMLGTISKCVGNFIGAGKSLQLAVYVRSSPALQPGELTLPALFRPRLLYSNSPRDTPEW